ECEPAAARRGTARQPLRLWLFPPSGSSSCRISSERSSSISEMSGESAVLRFDDVSLYFGDTPALVHVSFEMGAGETRVVLGASGSGKTMLLKTALGLVKPDSGRINLFGQDISGLK